ncbi:hypothetical protein B6D17_04235 [Gilliamella apis]|uniref:D-Ala-D-Ala carboxypeptidase family metallohydrolase n=1 Tax=Gilliamella apis TaxID=1970738 RepID=UPI000A347C77|nr:D-Ala-D-Ala carboxypeptidase family metallohydrolase [Gilliamella apis]OTQ71599.1 hypothetical protein B6D17_04235 [Gilliamella apis]OTQ74873.1 hypothetical protein B6C90_07680 [Gilliamella apis]
MRLTEHFRLEEFTRSTIAARLNIDNHVPDELMANIQLTANQLELVRKALAHPIIITSGYRCPTLNSQVGGSQTSAHTKGLAVDFHCAYGNPKQICQRLITAGIEFDKIIQEYNQWVHIEFSHSNQRRRVITAVKQNGKTIYLPGLV